MHITTCHLVPVKLDFPLYKVASSNTHEFQMRLYPKLRTILQQIENEEMRKTPEYKFCIDRIFVWLTGTAEKAILWKLPHSKNSH